MKGILVCLCLASLACGGTTPSPVYPDAHHEPQRPCTEDPLDGEVSTQLREGEVGLRYRGICGTTVSAAIPTADGVQVGEAWLVFGEALRSALSDAARHEIPPPADWIHESSDVGQLAPLPGGWFHNVQAAPALENIHIDDAAAESGLEVIQRVRAVVGSPSSPIFVVSEWDGEVPPMVAVADVDADVMGPRFLRAHLGPGDAWLNGIAAYLWQVVRMREGTLTREQFFEEWLELYTRHRSSLTGEPHRQSALAAQVVGMCQMRFGAEGPLLRPEMRPRAQEPSWMSQRGVLDVAACLRSYGLQLAAVRYDDASPERILRVGSAPGDPPRVERGRGFFEAGDLILEVNGRTIRRRGDIAWALRDVDTGNRFTVAVDRGGRRLRTWARRPRVGERDAVRFALIPIPADES